VIAELPASVSRSRLQLMLGHPFLANAVARFPMVNASDLDWCNTMATDGYYIYVNSEFCDELSEQEIMGVLAHEVLHCILGHLDRRGEREKTVWGMAIDYATNALLLDSGLTLPRDRLYDQKFRGMTAEDIYDLLRKEGIESTTDGSNNEFGADIYSAGLDRHVDPGDLEGAPQRNDEFPTAVERQRLRISLTKELSSQLPGRESGYWNEEIEKATTTQISWEKFLARFVSGLRRNDYRIYPFNKKHLWRGLFLPSIGAPGPDLLVLAIDTSASMNREILSTVLAEIDGLRGQTECKLMLIECDTEIKGISSFESWELTTAKFDTKTFRGRGGTSLKPPFDWVNRELLKGGKIPDALIYLTDGYGEFPVKPPPYPCLWVVPQGGVGKVPFGEILSLD
jgi:predicted metal-dependent peptidase